MGDLAFGKSFNMLKNGVNHYFMTALHADMLTIGILGRLTWIFPFFKLIPGLSSEHKNFWKWLGIQVDSRRVVSRSLSGIFTEFLAYKVRLQNKPDRPDVFSWLLEEYESSDRSKQLTLNLHGDAYLIVVAGR